MKFKQFLLDRLVYVWMYFIAVAVVLLIVWLDLLSMKQTVTVGSMVYVFLMTTVLLGLLWYTITFVKGPFWRKLTAFMRTKIRSLSL
ncbi:hypothetical protein [Paenibacillus larvae]|uniref:hypothetical protein n=1 Tax=Paenibacillus larvae TaxID=1464 RepID=UPI00098FC7A8|nr:hypothetical protein [Paenibacillus larvae]